MIVVTHSTVQLRALSNCQPHIRMFTHSFSDNEREKESRLEAKSIESLQYFAHKSVQAHMTSYDLQQYGISTCMKNR